MESWVLGLLFFFSDSRVYFIAYGCVHICTLLLFCGSDVMR